MELHVSLTAAVPNGAWVEYIPQLDAITTSRLAMDDGYALPPVDAGLGIEWDFARDRARRPSRGRRRPTADDGPGEHPCSPAPRSRSACTPNDDVVIARQQLVGGTKLLDENVTVVGLVPPGHKVATRAIAKGEPVKRYNQIIGFASRDIAPGEHVHLHNLAMGDFRRATTRSAST